MNAYHKDLGFPSSLVIPREVLLDLNYSLHAQERKVREEYKVLVLPTIVKITDNNVIEAHSQDDVRPNKLMLRVHFDRTRDIILIVQPFFNTFTAKVITFWLGHKYERKTPIKEKYKTLSNV